MKEIEIRRGKTINTGNYESERVDVSVRTTIEDNEFFDENYHKLSAVVGALVDAEVKKALEG